MGVLKTPLAEESSSSEENEGEMSEARRRRKEKMNAKIEKRARKLMKKRVKEEKEKTSLLRNVSSSSQLCPITVSFFSIQSVNLGQPPYFDGTDYPKWQFDMKVHLYGLHPSIWEVVIVGVTPPPKSGIPTAEQVQDYYRNAQAVRVITSSLCVWEFNKVRGIEVA